MTKMCNLLGSRPEVMYECMYTRHKTQKRKIWHDGFATLYSSRRIIVYADDEGKAGKVIDETKLVSVDWNCKDEEHIETSKFLVEIVNETPVSATPYMQAATSNEASESVNTAQQSASNRSGDRLGPRAGLGGRTRLSNTNFPSPLNHGPSLEIRPGRVGQPYSRNASATYDVSTPPVLKLSFDFARNPTSEWTYVPNALNRTPDEVLAQLEK